MWNALKYKSYQTKSNIYRLHWTHDTRMATNQCKSHSWLIFFCTALWHWKQYIILNRSFPSDSAIIYWPLNRFDTAHETHTDHWRQSKEYMFKLSWYIFQTHVFVGTDSLRGQWSVLLKSTRWIQLLGEGQMALDTFSIDTPARQRSTLSDRQGIFILIRDLKPSFPSGSILK